MTDEARTTLGSVVTASGGSFRTGPFGTTLSAAEYSSHGVPVISVGEVGYGRLRVTDGTKRVGPEVVGRLPELVLRVNDIVFGRKGATDRSALVREDEDGYFLGSDGIRVRLGQGVEPRFIAWQMQSESARAWLTANATGTTMATLTQALLAGLPVWLPCVGEQARVAGALDDATAMVTSLEQMIAKKEAVKQGMMQELLTGRTRLPGFSDVWVPVQLGEAVRYLRIAPLPRAELDETSAICCLHYGDIHTGTSIHLDASTAVMPRVEPQKAARADRLEVGDVVFADASEDSEGVGKSVEIARIPPDGIVSGLHTIAARFDKSVLADGFKAYLQFVPAFRGNLLRLASGTKVLATTRTFISSLVVPLPPADEQRAIATVLIDADAELDALRARLDKARMIKQGMMQELLGGRTRLLHADAAT